MKLRVRFVDLKTSRLLKIAFVSLLLLLSTTHCRAQSELSKRAGAMNRRAAPYTKRLPAIDRIELIRVDETNEGGDVVRIGATKMIEGRQARRMAALWRAQAWDYTEFGDCHEPSFAIKFYAGDKLLLYASICWGCHNIYMIEPIVGGQGFHSRSRRGQKLLGLFKAVFPEART